ncbi:hypothetical protein [Bradyrhizobium sp. DASA03007]|uniref:hypothetical protein n=1 Tax=unclassified Bradyrhizobium TaxID=2631580 RepID=UPI003F70E488
MTDDTYIERMTHNFLGGPSTQLDRAMFPEKACGRGQQSGAPRGRAHAADEKPRQDIAILVATTGADSVTLIEGVRRLRVDQDVATGRRIRLGVVRCECVANAS